MNEYDDYDFDDDGEDDYDFSGDEDDDEDQDPEQSFNELDPASDDYLIDGVGFADPGGNSSLRAATKSNPRNQPCPTCHEADVLTPADVARGYQCNRCADRAEGRGWQY